MQIHKANLKFNGTLTKRKLTSEIIIHCSANSAGSKLTVVDVHNMHIKKNGWIGIGYNYYIDTKGQIWEGRPEDCVGAHVPNHNSKSIGICYCGGIGKNGKYEDTRNEAQLKAMTELCQYLHKKYPKATFHGHKEFDNKACPCFDVQKWIKTIDLDGNGTVQVQKQECLCSQCKNTECKNRK